MGLYDYNADLYVMNGEGPKDADTVYSVAFANIPQQINMTTAKLTAEIQKVMPEYQFDEGNEADIAKRKELCDKVRHKIAETSAAQKTGLRAEGGKIVQKRGLGGAMAVYVNKHQDRPELMSKYNAVFDVIKQEEEISAPIKGKDSESKAREAERKAKLKQLSQAHETASIALRVAILEDIAGNVQDLVDKFSKMDTNQLLKNYDEFSAIRGICDTPNTLVPLHNTLGEEKTNDLLLKLDPLTTLTDRLLTKMNVLASPIGHMVDPDQLLKLSNTQINALHDVTEHIFDIGEESGKTPDAIDTANAFSAEHNIFTENNLGLAFSPVSNELIHKAKASMGIDLTAKAAEEPMQVYDLFGNSVSDPIYECQKGFPVFYVSQAHPEKAPVLAFERDGKTYVGEEALAAYQQFGKPEIPLPEKPEYKPGFFKGIWDSIVELFGVKSDRMIHEEAMADYNNRVSELAPKNEKLASLHRGENVGELLNELADAAKDNMMQQYHHQSLSEYKHDHTVETVKIKGQQPQKVEAQPQVEKDEPVKAQPQVENPEPEKAPKIGEPVDDRHKIEKMELGEDPEDVAWKVATRNKPLNIQIDAGNAAKEIKENVAARKDIGKYEKSCYGFAIRRLESISKGDLRPTKELDNVTKTSLLSIASDKILHELGKNNADKSLVEQARKLQNEELLLAVRNMPTFQYKIFSASGDDLVAWAKHDFEDFKTIHLQEEFKQQLTDTLNKNKSKENTLSNQLTNNQLTNNQPTISQPQKGGLGK